MVDFTLQQTGQEVQDTLNKDDPLNPLQQKNYIDQGDASSLAAAKAYTNKQVFESGTISPDSLGGLTNYQAASVADMVQGITSGGHVVPLEAGQVWVINGKWRHNGGVSGTIADFDAVGSIRALDFSHIAVNGDWSQALKEVHDYANSVGRDVSYEGITEFKMRSGDVKIKTNTDFHNATLIVDSSDLDPAFKDRIVNTNPDTGYSSLDDKMLNSPSFLQVVNFGDVTVDTVEVTEWVLDDTYVSASPLYDDKKAVFVTRSSNMRDCWTVEKGQIKSSVSTYIKRAANTPDADGLIAYVYDYSYKTISVSNLNIHHIRGGLTGANDGLIGGGILQLSGVGVHTSNISATYEAAQPMTHDEVRIIPVVPWYLIDSTFDKITGMADNGGASHYVIMPHCSSNIEYSNLISNSVKTTVNTEWVFFSGYGMNRQQLIRNSSLQAISFHSVTDILTVRDSYIGGYSLRGETKVLFDNCKILNLGRASSYQNNSVGLDSYNVLPTITYTNCLIDIGSYSRDPRNDIYVADGVYDTKLKVSYIDCDIITRQLNTKMYRDQSTAVGVEYGVDISFIRCHMHYPDVEGSGSRFTMYDQNNSVVTANFLVSHCEVDSPQGYFNNWYLGGDNAGSSSTITVEHTDDMPVAFDPNYVNQLTKFEITSSKLQAIKGNKPHIFKATSCDLTWSLPNLYDDSLGGDWGVCMGANETYVTDCRYSLTQSPKRLRYWGQLVAAADEFFGDASSTAVVIGCDVSDVNNDYPTSNYTNYYLTYPEVGARSKEEWFNNYVRLNKVGCPASSRTTSAVHEGDTVYDNTLNMYLCWDGTAWRDFAGNLV